MPTITKSAAVVTLATQAGSEAGQATQATAVAAALAKVVADLAANPAANPAATLAGCTPSELLLELLNSQVTAHLLAAAADDPLVLVRRRFRLDAVVAACAGYRRYAGRQGQMATYALPKLCWALLAQHLRGLSFRSLERALRHDLLLRWFCGFALHDPTPDHTTLARFDGWLRRHAPGVFFTAILQQIDCDFPADRRKPQLGDTFALRARAADTNRTDLLRDVCRHLLCALERHHPQAHAALRHSLDATDAQALSGATDELRAEQLPLAQRHQRECDTAQAAAHCLHLLRQQLARHAIPEAAFATPYARQAHAPGAAAGGVDAAAAAAAADAADHEQRQRRRLGNWLDVLAKILADEFIFTTATAPATLTATARGAVRLRRGSKNSKLAPGRFRIGSAKDLEATYRLHGSSSVLGYNVALLTTDTFVRCIQAFTGARTDGDTPALLIAAQRRQMGFCPTRLIFDRAAGAPKRFADVARASGGHTQLVAPLLRAGVRGKRFSPDDFHFQPAPTPHGTITYLVCPQGQQSNHAYRAATGEGWVYRFLASQCRAAADPSRQTGPPATKAETKQTTKAKAAPKAAPCAQRCPLWDNCRAPTSRPHSHRQVFVSDYLFQQRHALAYLATADYRADLRARAAIERIIAALTRHNHARTARSRGIVAANHQVSMAATAFNLKRWCVLIRTKARPHVAP